jgi:electron transfer flavoprotein alpha subunit
MTGELWVFSEQTNIAYELIAGALEFSSSVNAVVIGNQELATQYIAQGASHVFLLPAIQEIPIEAYASKIIGLMQEKAPELFMVGMTNKGRTLAAMVAQGLNAPCVSECKSLTKDAENKYHITRTIFGGVATSEEICESETLVATIPVRSYQALEPESGRVGEITEVAFDGKQYRGRFVEQQPKEGDSVDVTAASVIVCPGRGILKEEDMSLIYDLAEAVDGVVGCTRPISEDFHWLPRERYIGLSGKTVKPKLFISVGSSGQIQHIAGAQEARIIVAINNDKNAPIFDVCDYGILADLYDAVPALTSAVKKLR